MNYQFLSVATGESVAIKYDLTCREEKCDQQVIM